MADGDTVTGRVISPVLIGREEELRRLVAAVSMPPAVVVLEGEAGIGKSRLLARLAARPEMAGRLLLRGRTRCIREPFPLGPLVEALRGSGDSLARAELSPVAGALRGLLPELASIWPRRSSARLASPPISARICTSCRRGCRWPYRS
ncbi:AAA family ATPase [Microtetraspora glauca]|uniref:AAA family ATPase n=1 Tax=Microtetraspora glauca TaxID=1996 RepID=A0ABV3GPV6_MICGL